MLDNIVYGYRSYLLTVIEYDHKDKFGNRIFKCRCDCGNIYYAIASRLNKKKVKSCGCVNKKRNDIISSNFWASLRKNARTRGIEFLITEDDIVNQYDKQNKKCALTGLEVVFGKNNKTHPQTASVDRIDSTKPYTKDNIQIVHKDINMSKWNLSQDRFIELAKAVRDYNLYSQQ